MDERSKNYSIELGLFISYKEIQLRKPAWL